MGPREPGGPRCCWGLSFSSGFGHAARIDDIGDFNGPAVALHAFSGAPGYYTATANGARGIQYGGPGACVAPPPVAVPNLIGLSTAAARNTIKLAGLKVGVVSSLIQPCCARFDQVMLPLIDGVRDDPGEF